MELNPSGGKMCRNKYKMNVYEVSGHDEPVEAPKKLGGTWGPGTYKYFKTLGVKKEYRFDHTKQNK